LKFNIKVKVKAAGSCFHLFFWGWTFVFHGVIVATLGSSANHQAAENCGLEILRLWNFVIK
jgi:hypothetical protein